MRFGEALTRARSQIIFLLGLLLASWILIVLGRNECVPASDIAPAPPVVYTAPAAARQAWRYFERNRDKATGLVASNEGGRWTTLADEGHALSAMLAAHRLGLIPGRELYWLNARTLKTLGTLDPRQVPAQIDTRSGRPLTSGATAIAPLTHALELIAWSYPANSGAALRELERWRILPASTPQVAPPSDAERNATLLFQAALAERGEK